MKTRSEDPQVDVPLFVSRAEPTSAASSEAHERDTPSASAHPPPPINPITTSMEANWGGWASFFSSKTLMVKTPGYGGRRVQDTKRDEDGMEVMDLDDDEDERDVEVGAFIERFWARGWCTWKSHVILGNSYRQVKAKFIKGFGWCTAQSVSPIRNL